MANPGFRIRIVCAAVGLATGSAAFDAQAADSGSFDAVQAIYIRALRLSIDMTQTQQGALSQLMSSGDTHTLDCLDTLREASSEVSAALNDVSDLANVASMMGNPADEKYASSVRTIEAKSAVNVLTLARKEANQTAGMCPTQAVVQYKARDLIQLIDDASTLLSTLQPKGG